mgnify:CR=1 FL=1|jgi:Uncharacterized enzymes related to aldose 1-epimerase
MNEKQANNLEIPGVVTLGKGRGDLPKVDVQTRWSRAEIYLQGAHVTQFQRTEDAPVLFMSSLSPFAPGKAIRGGVPICYPWFGPREGDVAHGFARIVDWHWIQTRVTEDGAELKFVLPEIAAKASWPKFATEYIVTIGDALSLELRTTNLSETNLELEDCLHTYLAVREVKEITVRGLESTEYLDKTDGGKCKREGESPIRVQKETNRVYFDTTQTIEVTDPGNGRVLRVEKSGSRSTVLWNPWTTQKLPDMPGEEHSGMICVESGNVGPNKRTVKPGEIVSLKATISSIKI